MSKDTKNYMLKFPTECAQMRIKNIWLPVCFMLAAIVFLPACNNNGPGTLGADVLPKEDIIGMKFTDTVQVHLETQQIDRLNTYRAPRQLFGNYVDPQFGHIAATTFSEVLPRSGLNFGDAADLMFDSLIIRIELGECIRKT